MAFAKCEGNRYKIAEEIAENHAILVIIFNLMASIATQSMLKQLSRNFDLVICFYDFATTLIIL